MPIVDAQNIHTNPLWEEMLDGENKPIMIEVCKYFREQKEAKNDN